MLIFQTLYIVIEMIIAFTLKIPFNTTISTQIKKSFVIIYFEDNCVNI